MKEAPESSRRGIDWGSGLMIAVTLTASLGAAWFYFGRNRGERSLAIGTRAPLLQLIDLETSEPLVLAGLNGKVVWIVFWSASSPSGAASLPVFERAWKRLKGHRRFTMAAIAVDSEPKQVRALFAESRLDIPAYLASPGSRRQLGVQTADPPLNVLVDADGTVVAIERGTGADTIDRITDQANRLLDELDPFGRIRLAGRGSTLRSGHGGGFWVSSSRIRVSTSWSRSR